MSHERSMEGSSSRLWKIMQIISKNLSWEEIKSYPQRIDNITKDKIIEVANKYLNDNYLIVRSDKGDPKKIKLDKPEVVNYLLTEMSELMKKADAPKELFERLKLNTN